ncbi:uncharacterized protein BDZ99DRAFT_224522 [Mytilinidion resinicola]|uniref:Uncharacterized protein n=1 Tax=Mytilinidion resinicola TaxID=574789 RepID=A0A6A6YXY0_9PEZI|nr:uncharacterized protein BDZ99DRAFT_224522 [Mytilinidion resinicola]KAF2813782.1 hypothetical protein BDZ99DRAFT_224522 [Mytilinidion resinicola]
MPSHPSSTLKVKAQSLAGREDEGYRKKEKEKEEEEEEEEERGHQPLLYTSQVFPTAYFMHLSGLAQYLARLSISSAPAIVRGPSQPRKRPCTACPVLSLLLTSPVVVQWHCGVRACSPKDGTANTKPCRGLTQQAVPAASVQKGQKTRRSQSR